MNGATVTGTAQAIELIGSNGTITDSTISAGPTSNAFIIRRSSAGATTTATISGSTINAGVMGFDISGGATINIIDSDIQSGGTGVRALDGSTANLTRTTIETSKDAAHGIMVASGSNANIVGSSITTVGTGSRGVYALATPIDLIDTSIDTSGDGAPGIEASSGGTVNATRVDITTSGENSEGLRIGGAGSTVNFVDGTIRTSGEFSDAIEVRDGGSATIDGTLIEVSGANSDGMVVWTGGSASLSNSTINASHDDTHGIWAKGGTTDLENVVINTTGTYGVGLFISESGRIDASKLKINTSGERSHGVNMGSGLLHVSQSQITTTGRGAVGVRIIGGDANITNSVIETAGYGADAINAQGGKTSLADSSITTSADEAYGARINTGAEVTFDNSLIFTQGKNSYGVQTTGYGAKASIIGSEIETSGQSAHGIFAYDNSAISLSDSAIRTTGNGGIGARVAKSYVSLNKTFISTSGADAHGVRISNTGSADISNSTIIATGEQSNGVVVEGESNVNISESYIESNSIGLKLDYTGSANIDRTTIKSSGYAAISLAGSTDLKLSNSSVIASGDNGSAVNLFSSTVITIPTRKGIEEHSINNVSLDSSYIYAEKAPAIRVASGTANIDVKNGSQIVGNGGTALEAFSDSETNLNADGNVTMWGDIIGGKAYFADQNDAIVNVSLENGSFWKGAGVNLNTVGIDTTSHWLMTGSSDVGVLSNDGVVEFDAAAPYKTLTAGTLDVNGGSFILNTKLNEGGAASETDKIVVTGDTNGNGFINVRNNGGTGAFTGTGATDGIQIV
ncbi:beta strand repeat-containing protein, partial [Ochrobactrum quorumnocens]|uniref:beta strand repeat-containing protein n=1 Tax=Ochrobactrum quorumnocens TaxID=271865 RepID=UPI003D9C7394